MFKKLFKKINSNFVEVCDYNPLEHSSSKCHSSARTSVPRQILARDILNRMQNWPSTQTISWFPHSRFRLQCKQSDLRHRRKPFDFHKRRFSCCIEFEQQEDVLPLVCGEVQNFKAIIRYMQLCCNVLHCRINDNTPCHASHKYSVIPFPNYSSRK